MVPDTPAWPLGAAVPRTVTEATEPAAGSSDQPRRAPALFPSPTPARSPPQSGSVGRGDGGSQDGHRPTGSQRGPFSLPILTLGPPVCTRPSPTLGWAASLQTLPWPHLQCSALTGQDSGNPEPRFSASQSLSSGRRFSASGSPFPAPPPAGTKPQPGSVAELQPAGCPILCRMARLHLFLPAFQGPEPGPGTPGQGWRLATCRWAEVACLGPSVAGLQPLSAAHSYLARGPSFPSFPGP